MALCRVGHDAQWLVAWLVAWLVGCTQNASRMVSRSYVARHVQLVAN